MAGWNKPLQIEVMGKSWKIIYEWCIVQLSIATFDYRRAYSTYLYNSYNNSYPPHDNPFPLILNTPLEIMV